MSQNENNPTAGRGYIFAALGVFLFSLKPILVKLAYNYSIDSTTLMALRMGFSLPIYLTIGVWLIIKGQVPTFNKVSFLPIYRLPMHRAIHPTHLLLSHGHLCFRRLINL